MTITFHCQHCGKKVQAPDSVGGQQGKCPYCHGSNYIPDPKAAEEEVPLAPLDEGDEVQRQREVDRLLDSERALHSEVVHEETQPRLSQREPEEVAGKDLHHLVVNYCLDISSGKLERADMAMAQLSDHPEAGRRAVLDFLEGRALEPALDTIPTKVLQGLLKTLLNRL